MIPRYTRPAMARIWEPENRFAIWYEIEALACEAQAELGVIPKRAARAVRKAGKTKLKQITDGPSGTLLIVEAKRSVPWTKPDDIPYAADKPLPKFGGWFDGGFSAAFADGHVEFISAAANKNALRASSTNAGGEGDEPPT